MTRTRLLMAALAALSVSAAGCKVEVKDKGELPEVEVKDAGELPKVDIDPANVEITTDTQQVVTPEVNTSPATPDKN